MVVGARDELRSILLTLVLTPLKGNTQFICEFVCTLLNLAQILHNHFLTQNSLLKTCSQICSLLLQLCVLFCSIEKLTHERTTPYSWRSQNSVARRMIKPVLKSLILTAVASKSDLSKGQLMQAQSRVERDLSSLSSNLVPSSR
jgi:hypothetical protein